MKFPPVDAIVKHDTLKRRMTIKVIFKLSSVFMRSVSIATGEPRPLVDVERFGQGQAATA
jgi:hypothetical protein